MSWQILIGVIGALGALLTLLGAFAAAVRRFPALLSPRLRAKLYEWLVGAPPEVIEGLVPREELKPFDRQNVDRHLNYSDIEEAIDELTPYVQGFVPDALVAVDRGGAVVAGLLSKKLKHMKLSQGRWIPIVTLSKRSGPTAEEFDFEVPDEISGKRVFLVDDVCRTGLSMEKAKKAVLQKAAEVKTAVILIVEFELGTQRGRKPVDHSVYSTKNTSVQLPWDLHAL